MTSFKDKHPELQHIVREMLLVRSHNLKCAEEKDFDNLLHFAEGALVLLALERFARIVLGSRADERDTLYNLLQKAVKYGLLHLPWDDQEDGIRRLKDVRNTTLHGGYEQAAAAAGCSSVAEYFRSSQHIGEVETLTKVLDHLMRQVDLEKGPVGAEK